MLAEIKPFLDWLQLHPHWGGFIAGLIAFSESLVVIGLLIPGSVMMTAIGTLIGADILPFTITILWAIAGAILGDTLSFWLGHHYHERLRDFWPFRTHPKILAKGEQFFLSHGRKGVFIGRFLGPIRPMLPVIAGMLSMPIKRFLLADVISAILWAPVYMLPGILLGAASQELPPDVATKLILFVVAALLTLWCLSWLLKKMYARLLNLLDRQVAWLWKFTANHPRLYILKEYLLDPTDPHNHNQLALALLFITITTLFLLLTFSVIHDGWLTYFNESVYYFMRSIRSTAADKIFINLTLLSPSVLVIFWLSTFAWLSYQRYWHAALHWLAVGLLAISCTEIIKHLLHTARPIGLIQTPNGFSFPSGHSTLSAAFFGGLAVLLTRMRANYWRWIAYSIASIAAIAIMISRLYLGAHWLTDVVGGAFLGYGCVLLMTLSYRRKATESLPTIGILIIASLSLSIAWTVNTYRNQPLALHDYTPYWTNQIINQKTWWSHKDKAVPLYRINRFGKPIELFNVQWAGNLLDIKKTLTAQGWHVVAKTSLLILLNELAGKENDQQVLIMSQFYEDRKPVLVMTKRLKIANAVMVLRLWDAHLTLQTGQPLWLGTVAYHEEWQARFLKKHPHNPLSLPLPVDILSNDVNNMKNEKVNFPRLKKNRTAPVLFVQSE